jgi:hypothetical protein
LVKKTQKPQKASEKSPLLRQGMSRHIPCPMFYH